MGFIIPKEAENEDKKEKQEAPGEENLEDDDDPAKGKDWPL